MFARLSATLLLALACAAHPLVNVARTDHSLVSLPIAKHLNLTGPAKLIKHDQLRARKLFGTHNPSLNAFAADASGSDEVALTNTLVSYTVKVEIGSPPTTYELIVDTGSSNTWIGARYPGWHPTSTSHSTSHPVHVNYGSGYFAGMEVSDRIKIGDLVIDNQSLGSASYSKGFNAVDGILGIGPTILTKGTTVPSNAIIPTVVDTAAQEGLISERYVGIYFQPPTKNDEMSGVLTFGHADSSKFTGSLYEVPITTHSPASNYVGIDQSITYGSSGVSILPQSSGIVDTGTTLILLATSAFNEYMKATGASLDERVGLLSIPANRYKNLESLYFLIGSKTFELTPNAQIWPRSLNEEIGGSADKVYLIVGDAGDNTPDGLRFINGQTFLERFYTTYDSTKNTFGIAETEYTRYEGN
ncbi:aspartic peptidase A1 [Irpex rosettiformis]|uniref:Aspartic peptidase A1 n=1 Tax=Irpex rosettiformis TaxID=378272 RepID=A0ACB8U5S7_9APHY|nr:aspartic peptidase A1 [Irpex rosettiformis]